MGALASFATVLGAGASLYGTVRQAQAQSAMSRAQAEIAKSQEEARQQELLAQREAERASRQQTLSRTVAAARARLAASGVAPDDGSAGALTAGFERVAAEAEGASEEALRARLARGRASLLNPDGTLTAMLQSGRSFGALARSLLD
ncbi:hypothetical protein [Crenalkalicoccus roseus]|uniref:hypothetical protein n=1 Tax=Crenalkalicoccus roseus TaxID=1485588 RepID=UPI001080B122|nr:hypothetical protein [Crenalkalicoccus roseus]